MLPNTKALLAFAGRFLLSFCLVLPVWFLFAPAYNRFLASSVNLVLPLIESASAPRLMSWKYDILLKRPGATSGGAMKIQGFKGNLTHFNLITMVALVFSIRRIDWRSRCKMLAIALGILVMTHLAYLLIGIKFFEQPELEAFQSSSGRLYAWGINFYLSMASQLLPFAIGLFLYRFVVQFHELELFWGPERRVGKIVAAETRSSDARRARGKGRRKTDKGTR